ncbi:13001_t:CDS:2, partial [Dentiscutata erythropus]
MHESLDPIMNQLDLLDTLLYLEDSLISDFFRRSNTMPYFCVSWIITWCSHDLHDFSKVTRLFDFFISSNPLMALYLTARVIISRRKELLLLECDNAIIHGFLSKFPQEIDVDDLIFRTTQLYQKYPPHELQEISGLFLDKTSSINLYDKHWLILKADDTVDYSEANRILLLPPSERKPDHIVKPKNKRYFSNLSKTHTIALLFAASASVVAVVLIASRWFMRRVKLPMFTKNSSNRTDSSENYFACSTFSYTNPFSFSN